MSVHDPQAEQTLRHAIRESMLRRKELSKSLPVNGWDQKSLEQVEKERQMLSQLAKDLGFKPTEFDAIRKVVSKEVMN